MGLHPQERLPLAYRFCLSSTAPHALPRLTLYRTQSSMVPSAQQSQVPQCSTDPSAQQTPALSGLSCSTDPALSGLLRSTAVGAQGTSCSTDSRAQQTAVLNRRPRSTDSSAQRTPGLNRPQCSTDRSAACCAYIIGSRKFRMLSLFPYRVNLLYLCAEHDSPLLYITTNPVTSSW